MNTASIKKQQNLMTQGRLGFTLIAVGGFAFMANQFDLHFQNWWSLFIFLPAIMFHFVAVNVRNHENGRYPVGSRILHGISLVIFVTATMFLLNVDWGRWWPMMLFPTRSAFINIGWHQVDSNQNPSGYSFAANSRWLGIMMVLLGAVFTLNQAFGVTLGGRFEDFAWWGFFPLIVSVGVFFNAWKAYMNSEYQINGAAVFLGITGVFFAVAGLTELFNMSWNSLNNVVGLSLVLGGVSLLFVKNGRNSLKEEA